MASGGAGGGGNGTAGAANAVLYQPVLIAFPGAYALAKGLMALLSSLVWNQPIIWGLVAALIFSFLIYQWDQSNRGRTQLQHFALNTLILWLTVTGFVSVDALTGSAG